MTSLKPFEICILAGEKSGDGHAAHIVRHLKKYYSNAKFYGTGGPSLQKENVEILTPIQDLAMMGFSGVTRVLPAVTKTYFHLKKIWHKKPPAFIVPVDYGGFNLRICKLAKRLKIPVYYYIPPKIWAWNQKRVNLLRKATRQVYVINPFELKFYTDHGVNAVYAGNPSSYEISNFTFNTHFKQKYKLDINKKLIGLFPGSRKKEVEKLTPIFLDAAVAYYEKNPNTEFIICCPSSIDESIYQPFLTKISLPIKIIKDDNLNLMKFADFLILKSGTTTLEAGLIGTPMIVCYIIDPFTFMLAKMFVKVKFISLINLNLNREVVKELMQKEVNVDNILHEMTKTMQNENYNNMKAELAGLKEIMKSQDPAEFVAKAIYEDFSKI